MNLGFDYCLKKSKDVFTRGEAENLRAVTYLHSDDLLATDSLANRINELGNGMVFSKMTSFDKDGKIIHIFQVPGLDKHSLLKKENGLFGFPHHTLMWDLRFLQYATGYAARKYNQEGIFDNRFWCEEDRDATTTSLEAAVEGNYSVKRLPVITVLYRFHDESIRGSTSKEMRDRQHQIFSWKHFGKPYNSDFRLGVQTMFNDLPWSLFACLPESVKAPLRPAKEKLKRAALGYTEKNLIHELENYLKESK